MMHLERLILILEIAGRAGAVSVAEICAASDLPKPTVYRLVQELVKAGLLDVVSKGRFGIGARLTRIAVGDAPERAVRDVVAPVLNRAAEEKGAAFFLACLRDRAVEIVHVETPTTGVSFLHPGLGPRPLHACSCSKAVAAFSEESLLAEGLKGRLKSYTEFTKTRAEDLEAEFAAIRDRGYAECVEEIERGMCSVAVPLARGGPGASMSIGAAGSARVFSRAFRAEIGADLADMAGRLSGVLGWADAA